MKKPPPSYETQDLRAFAETLHGRRTIDLYLQTPVPEDLVHGALEAATWAPNHHMTEPWHFYLLGADTIGECLRLIETIVTERKSKEAGAFKAKAWSEKPGWLVVTCRKSDDELVQHEDYAACSAAVQNFMLYLWKAGVGTKWTTGPITRDERFAEIIGYGEDEFVVGLVWYGYPKLTPAQTRKDLETVLSQLP